jgi:hypothetical protein
VDDGAVEFEESVVVVVLPLVPVLVEVGLPSSELASSSRSRLSNESGRLSVRRIKWGSMMPEREESLRLSIMSADLCLLRERYSGGIAASAIAAKSRLVSDCEEMERVGGLRGERTGTRGGVGPGVVIVATRGE